MIFTKLKMNYFGRFQNREIELKSGINLIYGGNEAGKSTIHTFIRGMLFGIERLRGRGAASKEDIYMRYLPWEYPGAYGGSMDIRIGEKEYRLQRSFHANDKSFVILDLSSGREVRLKEGMINELIPGLTESTYKNTISIEQLKAQTDTELAAQVRNYIANLSIAKSKEVNVAKTVSILADQRKQLESAQNTVALKTLQTEIEEGLEREERMDRLTLQLRELLAEEQKITEQKKLALSTIDNEMAKQMEQLPAILEKYRSYQELNRQEKVLEQQELELKTKISAWEKEQQEAAALKEDIEELKRLQNKLFELEKEDLERKSEKERLNREARTNGLVSILPSLLMALAVAAVTKMQPIGMLIFTIIIIAGIIGFIILSLRLSKKKKAFKADNNEAKQNTNTVQAKLQDILRSYGITRIEELSGRQEEAVRNAYMLEHVKEQQADLNRRLRELEDGRDSIYEIIMKYMQHFIPEEELTDIAVRKLQEVITGKRRDTAERLEQLGRQQEGIKLRIEKLRWEIAALEGNEEELLKNKERYSELEQKQKENAVELEAVKLALSVIQELSTDIHDSFGQQLNIAVTEIIHEITGQKYNDLKVDEKLEVKVGWKGDYVLLERLSAGTIDQIYFALRMAVADLLLGKDEVPLLLDDSFTLYDETRVKAALMELSHKKQVILLTCHRREQQLLKELGLSYHLVELSQD